MAQSKQMGIPMRSPFTVQPAYMQVSPVGASWSSSCLHRWVKQMGKYEYYSLIVEIENLDLELESISEQGHEIIGIAYIATEQILLVCKKPREVKIEDILRRSDEED